ncbi:ABC transporter ATP-binding protein [Microlunatus sp. GCM10028923]|uniref:ABC transporter ATP-binding protein n=1 Tax=Microlunatus sp. GCM10028923 TaxID=3273400 RepID=UPI00361EAE05
MNSVDNSPPEPGPEPVLRVRGLDVRFRTRSGDLSVVRDVDLEVGRGEVVALLGESGSGKSVTARAIMGLLEDTATATADELWLAGRDLTALDERGRRELRGTEISLVMQDALSALNPVLSVDDQLGELFRVRRGLSRSAARAKAVELLGLVGIPAPRQRIRDHPHQFSGGMRQRILIAMAIALEPKVLIADEPTTALDVTVQAQILDLLDRLRDQLGMGILLITHDLGVVLEVADRLAVMYAGRVVEAGAADPVLDRPAHPYTQALLRSMPQAAGQGSPLIAIPGSPPNPARTPSGCAFHPRCPVRLPLCREVRPEPAEPGPGRIAACHRSRELITGTMISEEPVHGGV